MKKFITYLLLLGGLSSITTHAVHAGDRILVVANVEKQHQTLTREQVRNLFMGASVGYQLYPVALPPQNRTRSLFNAKVIGMAESRIQSYWAQMKFTGRLTPPDEVNSEKEMIRYLSENQGSIGSLPADAELPDNLTVLYSVE